MYSDSAFDFILKNFVLCRVKDPVKVLLSQRQCTAETLQYIFDFPGLDVLRYDGKHDNLLQKVLEFAYVNHEKALDLIEKFLKLPRVIF